MMSQGSALSELRHQSKLDADEKQRLEAELAAGSRQLQMLRASLQSNGKSREADERRIEAHREQEKHWKCGYESIF